MRQIEGESVIGGWCKCKCIEDDVIDGVRGLSSGCLSVYLWVIFFYIPKGNNQQKG